MEDFTQNQRLITLCSGPSLGWLSVRMLDWFSHFQGKGTSELLILRVMLTHNLDYILVAQLNIFHILPFSMYVFQLLNLIFFIYCHFLCMCFKDFIRFFIYSKT